MLKSSNETGPCDLVPGLPVVLVLVLMLFYHFIATGGTDRFDPGGAEFPKQQHLELTELSPPVD